MSTTAAAISAYDIANYVDAVFLVYTILLVIYVISSMVLSMGVRVPYSRPLNGALGFLRDVSEPYLRIFRRFIPMVGPFDLTPLVALVLLSVVRSLVVALIRGF